MSRLTHPSVGRSERSPSLDPGSASHVRATCPDCDDIVVSAPEVTVRICVDTCTAAFTFVCPQCRLPTAKPTTLDAAEILLDAGAGVDVWTLPAELHESRRGPAITDQDVRDFHDLLATDRWIDGVTDGPTA